MSELGDLLVLLHGANARVASVRAVVRQWRHVDRTRAAMARWMERSGGTAYGPVGWEGRADLENVVRFWFEPPDRVREERSGDDGERLGIQRGGLWWSYDPRSGAQSNEGEPEVGSGIGQELHWLLEPAPAMGLLEFGAIAAGTCAGRATLRVRAVPRASRFDMPLMQLGAAGADELVLDVDAERGTLLRVEARVDGEPYAIVEVLEIAFDERFPPDTFVFTPPPGEEVRPIRMHAGIRRDLTIEEAVALAPFTVWIPARAPAGWEIDIAFAAAHDRPPAAPHVFLHYRSVDGMHGFSITESPADQPADEEAVSPGSAWRELVRDGRRMEIREPLESWQPTQLRMELDGTRIRIHSDDLGAEALADLAAGLVRAPSEPPRLG